MTTAPVAVNMTEDRPSAPVAASERIQALDVLRGFALLGILLMNIVAMGLYFGAYDNPTVAGGDSGPNLAVWAALHVLAEGKMRALFSLVFGASMVLLTSRLEPRGDAADIYYRRLFWLLLFGVAHAYLLWLGDILFPYALCGLFLYPFRKSSPRFLLTLGGCILGLTALFYLGAGFAVKELVANGPKLEQKVKDGASLTFDEQDELRGYQDWRRMNRPTAEELQHNDEQWRGSVGDVLAIRAKTVGFFHSFPIYHPWNLDIVGMMFLGMALMRMGVLSGEKPAVYYARMMLWGYGIGIPVKSFTAWLIIENHFDPAVQTLSQSTYDLGRITIGLGHIGLVLFVCKTGAMRWLTSRLAAVGQMAFSNYLFHSVVTAFFFTGYGLGYYGMLQRYELYYVVGALWIVQLFLSPIWLRHYRFGPLEWVWRSLTYWKKQPMRITS